MKRIIAIKMNVLIIVFFLHIILWIHSHFSFHLFGQIAVATTVNVGNALADKLEGAGVVKLVHGKTIIVLLSFS